jgi:hypothetical protein
MAEVGRSIPSRAYQSQFGLFPLRRGRVVIVDPFGQGEAFMLFGFFQQPRFEACGFCGLAKARK